MPREPESVQVQAARMLAEDMQTMAKQLKDIEGKPHGVQSLGRDAELWAWGFQDESIDVDMLRAQGHPDTDIVKLRFPLQEHLKKQAGVTWEEQKAYADKMTARWLARQQQGKPIVPPERPPERLTGG